MLGENVRTLRKARKWTQQELAQHTGLAQNHLSMIETGQATQVAPQTLQRLARAFGITVDELLQETPPTTISVDATSTFLRELKQLESLLTPKHQSMLLELARELAKESTGPEATR
jgi:transcriptional regulator with XRE-family HTH domain